MDRKTELLSKYFGYKNFRKGQEELIDAVLSGRDVFGIMPTGGGKSMCYQLPALMMKGITIVISPLISLMKDQVLSLKNAGISAAYVNSSLTIEQLRKVYGYLADRRYKIVYVAPERLFTEGFLNTVKKLDIAMVAVDEAHCISQWGQDFRPSYLKIPQFISSLPARPVVTAFTATATPEVQSDIIRILELSKPFRVVTGFDRPNLYFDVLKPSDKLNTLKSLLSDRKDKCGIVYCSTRKDVDRVCENLSFSGFSVTRYHAGLSDEERRLNQDDFIFDRKNIIVATNAFGMGIDKSNVSYVIHYNMPKSPEAYYQEAGRAGRDGEKADCILLFAPRDISTAKFLINNSSENEELSDEERLAVTEGDNNRLNKMIEYCNTSECLRAFMLNYFGQAAEDSCDNCGNCKNLTEYSDMTESARTILLCTESVYKHLGYTPGLTFIIKVLRGSKEAKISALGTDKIQFYGDMAHMSANDVRQIFDRLLYEGFVRKNEFDGVVLTKKAKALLTGEESFFMAVRKVPEKNARPARKNTELHENVELYEILRKLRMKIAREENVPAYIIFSNATLSDMARKAPETREEFLEVSGVGQAKAKLYADIFIEAIRKSRA